MTVLRNNVNVLPDVLACNCIIWLPADRTLLITVDVKVKFSAAKAVSSIEPIPYAYDGAIVVPSMVIFNAHVATAVVCPQAENPIKSFVVPAVTMVTLLPGIDTKDADVVVKSVVPLVVSVPDDVYAVDWLVPF